MNNLSKKKLTNQEQFVKNHHKHHHQVAIYRILIFVLFLTLWEASVFFG